MPGEPPARRRAERISEGPATVSAPARVRRSYLGAGWGRSSSWRGGGSHARGGGGTEKEVDVTWEVRYEGIDLSFVGPVNQAGARSVASPRCHAGSKIAVVLTSPIVQIFSGDDVDRHMTALQVRSARRRMRKAWDLPVSVPVDVERDHSSDPVVDEELVGSRGMSGFKPLKIRQGGSVGGSPSPPHAPASPGTHPTPGGGGPRGRRVPSRRSPRRRLKVYRGGARAVVRTLGRCCSRPRREERERLGLFRRHLRLLLD